MPYFSKFGPFSHLLWTTAARLSNHCVKISKISQQNPDISDKVHLETNKHICLFAADFLKSISNHGFILKCKHL